MLIRVLIALNQSTLSPKDKKVFELKKQKKNKL